VIRSTEGGFQPKADEPLAQIRASEKPLLLSYPVFCVLAIYEGSFLFAED